MRGQIGHFVGVFEGLLGLVEQVEVGQSRRDQQVELEGSHRSQGWEQVGLQVGLEGSHRSLGQEEVGLQEELEGSHRSQEKEQQEQQVHHNCYWGQQVLVGVLGVLGL